MLHVYHGRGKGKTSAAFGALLRAHGQGLPVLAVQFLKDARSPSGEVTALSRLSPPVGVLRAEIPYRVCRPVPADDLPLLRERTTALFDGAASRARRLRGGLVLLDELGPALAFGLLGRGAVEALLDRLAGRLEVVVTGVTVPRWLLDRADYVTRMTKERHPMDRGLPARRGVEY